jgi:uroporphyrinogen-III synthase
MPFDKIHPLKRDKGSLSHERVLLTRSGTDNDTLATTLRQLGAVALVFPCLQIKLLPAETWLLSSDQSPTGIIFTSRYAVLAVAKHWPAHWAGIPCYAIGPGTASLLRTKGLCQYPRVAMPATTEGLLTHEELQLLSKESLFIIGGKDPRPLLQETLSARGAFVSMVTCYERHCPFYSVSTIERLESEGITSVVIQSMSCLQNLAQLLRPLPNHSLWQTHLLVPTHRYLEATKAEGFCGRVTVTGSTDDAAILEALQGNCHD